jgi:hypothetical protein
MCVTVLFSAEYICCCEVVTLHKNYKIFLFALKEAFTTFRMFTVKVV